MGSRGAVGGGGDPRLHLRENYGIRITDEEWQIFVGTGHRENYGIIIPLIEDEGMRGTGQSAPAEHLIWIVYLHGRPLI